MPKCIFCDIANKKLSAEILYEDDEVVAFQDINPQAPTHVLVIPRKHIESLNACQENDRDLLGKLLLACAKIAGQESVDKSGFRVVVNTGPDSGQAVDHVHFHILGGRRLRWPPG